MSVTKLLVDFEGDTVVNTINDNELTTYNITLDTSVYKYGDQSVKCDYDGDAYTDRSFITLATYTDGDDHPFYGIESGAFTFDFWVRINDLSVSAVTMVDGFNVAYGVDDEELSVGFGSTWLSFSDATMTVSTWHHIAIVGTGSSSIRMFLDGTELGTAQSASYTAPAGSTIKLGRSSEYYDCKANFDNVRIAQGALWDDDFDVTSDEDMQYSTSTVVPITHGFDVDFAPLKTKYTTFAVGEEIVVGFSLAKTASAFFKTGSAVTGYIAKLDDLELKISNFQYTRRFYDDGTIRNTLSVTVPDTVNLESISLAAGYADLSLVAVLMQKEVEIMQEVVCTGTFTELQSYIGGRNRSLVLRAELSNITASPEYRTLQTPPHTKSYVNGKMTVNCPRSDFLVNPGDYLTIDGTQITVGNITSYADTTTGQTTITEF